MSVYPDEELKVKAQIVLKAFDNPEKLIYANHLTEILKHVLGLSWDEVIDKIKELAEKEL